MLKCLFNRNKEVFRFKSSQLIYFVLLFCFFFSPFQKVKSQEIQSFVITPPEKVLPNVKKIAILNFENFDKNPWYDTYGGAAFVDYLTAKFLDDTRGIHAVSGGLFSNKKEGKTFIKSSGINSLQIVEREQLNKILNEKNLAGNVSLSENQAAEIGKVLGIDVLIMGTIKHNYTSNRTYSYLNDGSKYYTTENNCISEAFIKIVSVENAQIIASKTYKRSVVDKQSGSNEINVLKFDQLAEINLKNLAFDVTTLIAPYYSLYNSYFEKIKVKEFKDKASDINVYFENGDLKSVYNLNKAIYDADNYNAESAANIARLHYMTGGYKDAAEWIAIAYEIDSKKYGQVNEGYKACANWGNILNDLGVQIEKYDFSMTNNSDLLADKITTKGKKADRYDVYEKPDQTSTVVTKIPGDTEFVVIKKVDNFVLIKLLGGKEGYIPNVNVK